jgi:STE24 endopeptidase
MMLDLPAHARAALLQGPFLAWDLAVYLLRWRGDRSPARRATLLRYFTAEDLEVGRAHLRRQNAIFPLARLLHYGFFAALLFGGLADRLENALLASCGGSWAIALPLFLLLLLAARLLLSLPLAAYAEFRVQREAGLSTVTVMLWLLDHLKSLLLGALLLCAVTFPLLALVHALPQRWPLPAAAVVLSLSAFLLWVKPWVIDPLFNRFAPLADPALAAEIRALAGRAGVGVDQVYVMDASRRSRALNAYFTGLGSSRRVVLFDTLVEACPPPETLSVVAHELGHWRGRHLLLGFLLEVVVVVVGLQLLAVGFWGNAAGRAFLGVGATSELAALVALPLLADLAGTIVAPVGAVMSRRLERAADRAALELAPVPAAFASLEQRLVRRAKVDLLQPRLVHWWYGSHPLPEERLALSPTTEGEPPVCARDEVC